jgi:hypothetical protein
MHLSDVQHSNALHHSIVLHHSPLHHAHPRACTIPPTRLHLSLLHHAHQRAASHVAEFCVWSSTVLTTFDSRVLYASALRTVRDGFLALRKPDQVAAGQVAAGGPPMTLAAGAWWDVGPNACLVGMYKLQAWLSCLAQVYMFIHVVLLL